MEYKKDKRTKNLTLREIHVGDWVQVWSKTTERYSPPLKIIQICDDGTIYLVTSDEERPTPWEEDIKNVDALPITPDILKGFGFEVTRVNEFSHKVSYDSMYLGRVAETFYKGKFVISSPELEYWSYMHNFAAYLSDIEPNISLEWKGVKK